MNQTTKPNNQIQPNNKQPKGDSMKTQFLTLALTVLSASVSHADIRPGTYVGHGQWKSEGGLTGEYQATAIASADEIKSEYTYKDKARNFTMKLVQKGQGFFDILSEGKRIGDGYCMTVVCHYTVTAPEVSIEESLTFVDSN